MYLISMEDERDWPWSRQERILNDTFLDELVTSECLCVALIIRRSWAFIR